MSIFCLKNSDPISRRIKCANKLGILSRYSMFNKMLTALESDVQRIAKAKAIVWLMCATTLNLNRKLVYNLVRKWIEDAKIHP
jgi:hypothetical protein